jgi:hypothetical protein
VKTRIIIMMSILGLQLLACCVAFFVWQIAFNFVQGPVANWDVGTRTGFICFVGFSWFVIILVGLMTYTYLKEIERALSKEQV